MSKANVARLSFAIALVTSGWPLIVGMLAPFGLGLAMLVVSIVAAVASVAALVLAARKPRQLMLLAAAAVLVVGHVFFWSWVAALGITGGP